MLEDGTVLSYAQRRLPRYKLAYGWDSTQWSEYLPSSPLLQYRQLPTVRLHPLLVYTRWECRA